MHFDEYDGVILRNPDANSSCIPSSKFGLFAANRKSETLRTTSSDYTTSGCSVSESCGSGSGGGVGGNSGSGSVDSSRHSDGNLSTTNENGDNGDIMSPTRKFHTKSFSLSENRVGGALNLFQQNRELWEKRAAEINSQQSLTQSRILERKRIAPDLVMDLPLSANKDTALRSSRDSLDMEVIPADELTSAERFASQNQCTLKKNERFSTSIETMLDKKEVKLETKIIEKPKAEVKPQEIPPTTPRNDLKTIETSIVAEKKALLEEVLHIEEDCTQTTTGISATNCSSSSNVSGGSSNKDTLTALSGISNVGGVPSKDIHKSPIPARNTQKYVSQFADLKLTGGCLSQPDSTFTTNTQTTTTSGPSCNNKIIEQTPQLTSFKPQVKVKPQIFKKPFVRPPTTPEMSRRGGGSSSSGSQD